MTDYDDPSPRRPRLPGFVLPALTAMVATLGGTAFGGLAVYVLKPSEIVEKQIPRELTAAELEAACAPAVSEAATNLEQATDTIAKLESSVQEKEDKVKELEAEMKRRGVRGAELKKELEDAKRELEAVRIELATAIQEKEQLKNKLVKVKKALDVQKDETVAAREDSLSNQWNAFVNQAQLDICEKGNRKKLGKCREAVTALMDTTMMHKYGHCIRSGQEAPVLREAVKDEKLPVFASYLDQDDKIVKDWYVLLCDPSLPEAKSFASDAELAGEDLSEFDGSVSASPTPQPGTTSDEPEEELGSPGSEGLGTLLDIDEN